MNKGHIEFDSYEDVESIALRLASEKLYNALQVILKSEKLRPLLEVNDAMAYRQAQDAIKDYEDGLFDL